LFSILKTELKSNIFLITISTILSLYAAELFLSYINSLQIAEPVGAEILVEEAEKTGIHFDTRTKLQVITDMRRQGIEAYPSVYPGKVLSGHGNGTLKSEINLNGSEILPLGGIANKITVFCNESGNYLIYKSDEHGFHNPKGIWQREHIDIAVVGDSYAQGACVSSGGNFVALIRKHYPNTLNLGMGGSGPLIILATVKEYMPWLKPKVVLWCYYEGDDLNNLQAERNSPLVMQYLADDFSQGLIEIQPDLDRALAGIVERYMSLALTAEQMPQKGKSWTDRLKGIIKLDSVRSRLQLALSKKGADVTEQEIELFRTIMLQAKDTVSSWGGKLYFVYLPEWKRYYKPQNADKNRKRVLKLVRTLEIPLIDIHQAFQNEKDPLALFPFRLYAHYNEKGYKLVSEEVLKVISSGDQNSSR
jgi:hypothetical protein